MLVLHGIIKPVSITADPKLANIVWTDPARGTIELCDFYGKHRKVIKTDVNAKYYGIETFSVSFICYFIFFEDDHLILGGLSILLGQEMYFQKFADRKFYFQAN